MASNAEPTTIRPEEVAHFADQSADWWNPRGSSAMLHRLNPVRLAYIREAVDAHWGIDSRALRPLDGKRALDVGCGAGLVCEPLARLGAEVTGLDATPANIAVAHDHAEQSGLVIDYRAGAIEALELPQFDLVTCLEVIEHVDAPEMFVGHLARLLKPDGLMILSTPNRTARGRLAMITLAEGLRLVPPGTHDWQRFLKPEELEAMLADHGLTVTDRTGIAFNPGKGFVRSDDLSINYLLAVVPGNNPSAHR